MCHCEHMKTVLNNAMRFLQFLTGFFPTQVPRGKTEFIEWSGKVIEASGLPDNASTRFALSTMVLHLAPTADKVPVRFFVKSLRKAASAEVAFAVMEDLKAKQKADKEAAAKEQAEATAKVVVSSVTPTV